MQAGFSPDGSTATPPDTYGIITPTQFIVGDNNGLISYDRNGQFDGNMNAGGPQLINGDGNFSLITGNFDSRIHYDHLANRILYIQTVGDLGITILSLPEAQVSR